jgi:hypothetical protein
MFFRYSTFDRLCGVACSYDSRQPRGASNVLGQTGSLLLELSSGYLP